MMMDTAKGEGGANISSDEYFHISGLQHYYFCKRQWALIYICQTWEENALTMEGNLLHVKADNPFIRESRRDLLVSRAVAVSSKELGLTGILDVVEFYRDEENGVLLPGRDGLWHPNIVEYKRGKPKKNNCDVMQLTAQAMCLEEMLHCTITSADIFYATPKRRTTIAIDGSLRRELKVLIRDLRQMYANRIIPPAENYRNCPKCSLYNICMPRLTKKPRSIGNYIAGALKEEPYA
ncbi:MAG: CRISPR-associated protein Cas4 [Bacillota bacterium]|nr:CRISPR-associated protein Cas4 [Bacillota bacterium]